MRAGAGSGRHRALKASLQRTNARAGHRLASVLEDAGGKLVAGGGISFSTRQPRRVPVTERQLHIRAYRAARGAGLDTDAANSVAPKHLERCAANAPWLHGRSARIAP